MADSRTTSEISRALCSAMGEREVTPAIFLLQSAMSMTMRHCSEAWNTYQFKFEAWSSTACITDGSGQRNGPEDRFVLQTVQDSGLRSDGFDLREGMPLSHAFSIP